MGCLCSRHRQITQHDAERMMLVVGHGNRLYDPALMSLNHVRIDWTKRPYYKNTKLRDVRPDYDNHVKASFERCFVGVLFN